MYFLHCLPRQFYRELASNETSKLFYNHWSRNEAFLKSWGLITFRLSWPQVYINYRWGTLYCPKNVKLLVICISHEEVISTGIDVGWKKSIQKSKFLPKHILSARTGAHTLVCLLTAETCSRPGINVGSQSSVAVERKKKCIWVKVNPLKSLVTGAICVCKFTLLSNS